MPEVEIVVALWNRDTPKKQWAYNGDRLQHLRTAIEACNPQLNRILKPNQPIKGIFIAPEYYFAANQAGTGMTNGSFHERGISEADKDMIVNHMLSLSKSFPKLLLIPGTIAWKKSVMRAPGQEYKRDPQTYQRTTVLKTTPSRLHSLLNTYNASIVAGGSRGGLMPTELLKTKVRQELATSNPNGLVDSREVTLAVNALMNQPQPNLDADLISMFGTTAGMYKSVPTQTDSWNLIMSGNATHVMKNTAYMFLNGKIRFKYNKRNDYHEAVSDTGSTVFCPGAKSGYTTIEGIDIGIEICLDHDCAQLVNTPMPLSGMPMLHILTSAAVPCLPRT